MLIHHGLWQILFRKLKTGLSSDTTSFGLVRDLSVVFPAPEARIPIGVRPLKPEDVPVLFDMTAATSDAEIDNRLQRLSLLEANIPTCYVAVAPDGTPCFTQWLMGPEDNERIGEFFSGGHPQLESDQMLLEHAFTLEAHRGGGVMSSAMWKIVEKAREAGAKQVITFVGVDNTASLKGCKRAGFRPYCFRESRWRFFRRSVTFTPVPPGTLYPFEGARSNQ